MNPIGIVLGFFAVASVAKSCQHQHQHDHQHQHEHQAESEAVLSLSDASHSALKDGLSDEWLILLYARPGTRIVLTAC